MQKEHTKCLIIGSGPAGYTAGIYASRADLNPVLYEGPTPGGQLTITTEVENYPGYVNGASGTQITDDMRQQALRFGTDMRQGSIDKVDFSQRPFICVDDKDNTIEAETVIIATGATARWLGLECEAEYRGFGVSACATCDGFFFRGKDVVVIGGGDTALGDAAYLAKLCRKVYLVHRRNEFRASKAMQHVVFNKENIEIVWDSTLKNIVGTSTKFAKTISAVEVSNVKTGEVRTLPTSGVFIAIGHNPNSQVFKGQIDTDENGYIRTIAGTQQTNIAGVFAAGDVQDPLYRQAIVAAGSGCKAALEAEHFLMENDK